MDGCNEQWLAAVQAGRANRGWLFCRQAGRPVAAAAAAKGWGEKAGAASWERIIVFLPPLAVAVVMSA